jgi:chitodextrinase
MHAPSTRLRQRLALAIVFLAGLALLPAAIAAVSAPAADPLVGDLLARHSDDFSRGRSTTEYVVQSNGRLTPVRVTAQQAGPLLGKRVKVGFRADGSATLAAADGTSSGSTTTTTTSVNNRRVAILLVNFSNDTRTPWTADQVRNVAFGDPSRSVAEYFRLSTWGRIQLSGDVFGWFTIPDTNTSCTWSAWGTSANAAAAAAGIDLAQYQHVVYAFPSSPCGWSGLAYLPGKHSWLNGSGTSFRVMSHELGHNLGTHHAATMSCTEAGVRVPLSANSANCTSSEYGDPYSVMGASSRYTPTNVSRGNFGVLQSANTQTVTASGDYLLKPIDPSDPTGVQSLRVRRTTSTFLTLEFRQSDGSYFATYTSTDPVATGVTVRIASEYTTRSQTQLVDTTPATTSFGDAPLAAGRTLVDPLSGVSITALSTGSGGALVRISFAPDSSAPTQPTSLTATALDASRISLSWGASADNVGVAGYRVFRNGTLAATVTSTSWTDSGLSASTTYGYQVVAFDAAGNTSTAASASATTLVTDSQAPTAPGNLKATVAKKKVTLSWSASTDNVEVAGYRVYRDGALVATLGPTATGFSQSGLARGSYVYGVEAFDAAGNTSARPTASATVQ